MTGITEHEGFWDFSVRTYSTDGVADACLDLQNNHGADVNMLLYCCWIAARLGQFDNVLFGKASKFSMSWADNVVGPLRSARIWMKHRGCAADFVPTDACMRLREEIKSIELACEKMQQQTLESLASLQRAQSGSSARLLRDVIANLRRYSEHCGFGVSEDVRRCFTAIILAAFPGLDEPTVARAFDR